jgi:hypothetical protein
MRNKTTSIALFVLLFTILGFVLVPIIVVAPISEKEAQWIQNSDFEDSEGWIPIVDGDGNDLTYSINNGMANYIINGQEITFSPLSGTPTNTTAPYWYNSTNSRIDAYPTLGFELNETGFHASHLWDEHDGSIYNADQKVSVQWEKVINMPHNMADYNITDASLEITVNATVKEEVGYGADATGGYGGIDVYGDDEGNGWTITEGDYVKFYAIVANPEENISFTVTTYINKSLGRNEWTGENHLDYLFDTVFSPENMYDFIFYINQVLKGNNRNFTLILGMEFNCEDNFNTDIDEFVDVVIKACDFNITYERVIDQFSSVSWEYKGERLIFEGEDIEITNARLNFDYKTNRTIPFNLTSNSEFRCLINGNEHTETIKLYNAETYFREAKSGGFDVTNLVDYDDYVNLSIEVMLADEFGLDNPIVLSIDDPSLVINYKVYISTESPPFDPVFFGISTGLIAIGIAFGGYFLYYYKVLRFPKQVRTIRKFKKSLDKRGFPDIDVESRERGFMERFKGQLGDISNGAGTKEFK